MTSCVVGVFFCCATCGWYQLEKGNCIKCDSVTLYPKFYIYGSEIYIRDKILNQPKWIDKNNPTKEEKEKALANAKAHHELRLL